MKRTGTNAASRWLLLAGLSMLGLLTASLAGCNTVKGLGEDITNVGEAGEKAIDGK
ncbi:MAG: hypothetical protein SFZ23_14850 [Planctomycetota bacterium]|nr:hypothetical protein [Planctomycetota bacterium]